MRLADFRPTASQKKLASALFKQFPAAISVVFGALFLAGSFGRIGLGPAFIISGLVALYGIWRQTRRQVDEETTVSEMMIDKRIVPSELPVEFRFITNETTVQEVIDKAGPYSRIATKDGVVSYEYDLPYHAALIIFPEPPFKPESKIRTVFFRKPREDDDSMAL
jgi:hypothetical protein